MQHAAAGRIRGGSPPGASRRKAKIASIVDRPATNPDCCGLLVASSNGWILARGTWAKTLPGMESSVIGL